MPGEPQWKKCEVFLVFPLERGGTHHTITPGRKCRVQEGYMVVLPQEELKRLTLGQRQKETSPKRIHKQSTST